MTSDKEKLKNLSKDIISVFITYKCTPRETVAILELLLMTANEALEETQ